MAHYFILTVGTFAWFGMLYGLGRALRTYPDPIALWAEVRRTFAPCTAVCATCLLLLELMGPRPV